MKKTSKVAIIALTLVTAAALFCGCGNSMQDEAANYSVGYGGFKESADMMTDVPESAGTPEIVSQNRKIIEYVSLRVETKTFDELLEKVNSAVNSAGGYVENSSVDGNSFYGKDNRRATLKIRIPKSKQKDFSAFVAENSNVVNQSLSTDDVTNQYIDTQSRIKALTIEKETLEQLLTQGTNLADTLSVYDKLTDVIADIESYQSKLNQLDNLIDYTTFNLTVDEVEKETTVVKQNWFEKTWNGLINNLSDVGSGLLNFASFMIAALPYWILLGVIAFIVLFIIFRAKKRRAKKKAAKGETLNK